MDPRAQLDEIIPLLMSLVGGLEPNQLDLATPCSNFAVRDILQHMVGGATTFAAAFRGDEPTRPPQPETDLIAAFPVAMAELQSAVNVPGALDKTIDSPFGEMPGEAFARLVAMDGLVHGWDIAMATGVPYDPPDAVVADVDAFSRQALGDHLRDGDTFAAAVDPRSGASPMERLAAFTGRAV